MSSSNRSPVRVVIPARYGSTRLPGKPLIDLGGRPMIVRVYDRVTHALPESSVIVATDDQRIVDVLAARDIRCVMTDPAHASGTDRAAEVARRCGWREDDVVLNVQGDEPLVPDALLRSFADYCASAQALSVATVASPVSDVALVRDVNIVKVVTDQMNRALYFSRAAIPVCRDTRQDDQELPVFMRHIGMYAYRNAVLQTLTASGPCEIERREQLEQLRALWLGVPILVMPWAEAPPAGVDTPEDVARVSNLFRQASNERS